MNVERLKHLIEILKVVEASEKMHFDLSRWAFTNDSSRRYDGDASRESCGITACACGYAALDPIFIAQGLTLRISGEFLLKHDEYSRVIETMMSKPVTMSEFNKYANFPVRGWITSICFNDSTGFSAVAEFFGIKYYVAEYLFSDMHYTWNDLTRMGYRSNHRIRPKHVIARIENVLANDGEASEAYRRIYPGNQNA